MGNLINCITEDGFISAIGIDSTDMVASAEQIHKPSAVVTAALGRLLTAASVMGSALKGERDTLTIRLMGNGPAGAITAVSDSDGNVRGYAENNLVEIPLNNAGKLDVTGAVGKTGSLYVLKDLGLKEPYNGFVPIVSGEIAEDIAYYYAQSEQIPSVCALGVLINPDLTVKAAGGYLIQLLPGAEVSVIDTLERNIGEMESVTALLSNGNSMMDILKKALAGFTFSVIDHRHPTYKCNCSGERVKRAMISMGKKDLLSLAEEKDVTEVVCDFCNEKYEFTADVLRQYANLVKK